MSASEATADTPAPRVPPWVAPGLLAVVVGVLALASVLVLRATGDGGPAGVGDPVRLGSGTLTVTAAQEQADPMAAGHGGAEHGDDEEGADQKAFAAAGMSGMSSMSPDPIPAGKRRIRLDIRVSAGSEEVSFPADAFEVRQGSSRPVRARHSFLGDASLAPGLSSTGNVQFDIPEEWTHPRLLVDGAASPIHLHDLVPAASHDHGHGKAKPDRGHGHQGDSRHDEEHAGDHPPG